MANRKNPLEHRVANAAKKRIPSKYKLGGNIKDAFQDAGGVAQNIAVAGLDSQLSTLGLNNLADNLYDKDGRYSAMTAKMGDKFSDAQSKIAPAVAGVFGTIYGGPAGGAAASGMMKGVQNIGGQLDTHNPNDTLGQNNNDQMTNTLGQLGQMGAGMYGKFSGMGGQGATMGAAQVAKFGGPVKYQEGGDADDTTINVERNELEVKNGRVITDYKNKPKHPEDGSLNPKGNVEATQGNIIIPSKIRDKYLDGDKLTRATIEANLKRDQSKRERNENEAADMFAQGGAYVKSNMYGSGGTIHIKKENRGKFTASAKHAGMGVQAYAHHVMAHSSNSVARKRAQFAINASKWKHEQGGVIKKMDGGGPIADIWGNQPLGVYAPTMQQGMSQGPSFDQIVNGQSQMQPNVYQTQPVQGSTFTPTSNYRPGMNVLDPNSNFAGGNPYALPTNAQFPTTPQGGNFTARTGNDTQSVGQPNNGFDYMGAGRQLITDSPSIYNLGMGMFSKPDQMKKEDYQIKGRMPYRDVNFKPIDDALQQERRVAGNNAASASGGNSGSYLANTAQIGANTQTVRANAQMQAQQYNNQGRNAADQFNFGLDQYNIGQAMNTHQYNMQSKAKKSEFLGKGLEGASSISQMQQRDQNLSENDKLRMKLLDDMFNNMSPTKDSQGNITGWGYKKQA